MKKKTIVIESLYKKMMTTRDDTALLKENKKAKKPVSICDTHIDGA